MNKLWSKLSYDFYLRDHLVYKGLESIVEADTKRKHNRVPSKSTDSILDLDPGGMICLHVPALYLSKFAVQVKPEHILQMIYSWRMFRYLDSKTANGEPIIKVFFGERTAAVIPESIYNEIGSWLATKKTDGYLARAALAEKLNSSRNCFVDLPPVNGDA